MWGSVRWLAKGAEKDAGPCAGLPLIHEGTNEKAERGQFFFFFRGHSFKLYSDSYPSSFIIIMIVMRDPNRGQRSGGSGGHIPSF